MLEQILDDVERAFNAKAYWAGLTLALTIPDICGRAFYGNLKINERYIKWYDEYIGQYHVPPTDANQNDEADRLPLVNGLVIYKLRCALMHQGSLCLSGARENSRVKPGILTFLKWKCLQKACTLIWLAQIVIAMEE